MKLADYLKKHGISQMEFAARAQLSQATVSKLVTREQEPRIGAALRIVEVTAGSVSLRDLIIR